MARATHEDGWAVFDQAPGALVLADEQLVVTRANAAVGALLGVDPGGLVGRSAAELLPAGQHGAQQDRLRLLLEDGRPYAVDQRLTHASGHDVWVRMQVGVVELDGRRLLMAQMEDTTDRRRTTARLQRLAERDHLTGLLNRRRMEEELEVTLAALRRHGRVAALVLIDLDHFKAVNDSEGHEAGDQVLSFVAATLSTRVRAEDVVARLGGDEFAVLLRDAPLAAAEAVALEMVAGVGDAPYTRDRGVTLSAGVAALTAATGTAQDALHAADLAMYAAKAAGRNRVALHGAPDAAVVVSDAPAGPPTASARDAPGPLDVGGGPAAEALVPRVLAAVRELLDTDATGLARLHETLRAAGREPARPGDEDEARARSAVVRLLAGELERDAPAGGQATPRAQAAGAEALVSAIDARARYTGAHSREVAALAGAVADELGLSDPERHQVTQIALLHDIGKLALPDAILTKPAPLTPQELLVMRSHPEEGARIVEAIAELAHLAPAIRAEHERWDGTGYPDGLAGEAIPIASRVVFVCDAWHAMTSERPYRPRMPDDQATAELAAGAGSQFCRRSVQALFAVLDRG